MRIGVLGSGTVGQTLAIGFGSLGHEVQLGTRDPETEKIREFIHRTPENVSAGTFRATARFAEVAVIATAWSGTESALAMAGRENFAGKIVVDVTNPLEARENEAVHLALGFSTSAAEEIQRWLPGARVVKAFNSVTASLMVRPSLPGGPPEGFYCGDDEAAKEWVRGILEEFELRPIDLGGLAQARLLEPLAMLWVVYGFRTNTWGHAWKLIGT